MRRRLALLALLLAAAPAQAQWATGTQAPGLSILNAPALNFGVLPSSATSAPTAAGTGYTAGDVLTVTGGGGATLTVKSVSGGAITEAWVQIIGSVATIPANPVAVTGGTGSGATFALTWGPIAAGIAYPPLTPGGGNQYSGFCQSGRANLLGTEDTYYGYGAGCSLLGSFNTAMGHNALGIGAGGTPTGSNNAAFGTDTLRNFGGGSGFSAFGANALKNQTNAAANSMTAIGSGSMLNVNNGNASNDSSALGASSCLGVASTASFRQGTCLGADTGAALTTANNFLIIGRGVGNATFATGTDVVLIGSGNSAVDTPAAGTSNYINFSNIWTVTGTGTPSTSASLFAGTLDSTTGYKANGTAGVTCAPGSPTASFAATLGIVTHC